MLRLLFLGLSLLGLSTFAAVLPEDRADTLYHRYEGGGVTIDGPSILVRKSIGDSVSLTGNYYVDNVSSASIDVVTSASPYTEERRQKSLAVDYLRNNTLMNLSYINSEESDYSADTTSFSISQDMFGDLTTVTLGYSLGDDQVGKNGDPDFSESTQRQNYRLGLSQVLTKNALLGINWETITEEGFLNNPYRSVRYRDGSGGFLTEPEVYPRTRTSNALSFKLRYYLPYRAALSGEYRYFNDTWGIRAQNAQIGYTQPFLQAWLFDIKYRYYTQNEADFYSDLFARAGETNFRARDKELSRFHSQTLGLAISYEFARSGWSFIDHGSLNLSYDYMRFDYDNFRNLTVDAPAGEEPLYSFDANVWRAYLSLWY